MKKLLVVAMAVLNPIAHGASFDFDLSAFSLKETALLSRGTSTNIETKLNYQVDEDLKINFWPGANFSSGQQASRDQVNVLANTIYVKEASLESKVFSFLNLKAGALYQKEFLPGLSGQSKAFPSAGLKMNSSFLFSGFEFLIQAAVPTSTGLATNSSELQSNSTLLSATANLNINFSDDFKSQLSYSHFSFNNLTSASALDSAYRGNSVSKQGASIYSFVYGFQGDELLIKAKYSGASFDFNAKAGAIKNSLAPEQMNTGYFVSLEPGIRVGEKNLVRLIASQYRVESDAMVAVFSDSTFGRTNRTGTRVGVALEKNKYSWQLIYGRSDLIVANAFQSSDESMVLDLSIKEITF